MPLYEKLEVYQRAMQLSEDTWQVVKTWTYFHKDTLGKHIVRSADSIPANIAEGQGRYSFKERLRFCHYSRGSLYEYQTQLKIALTRDLIDGVKYSEMEQNAQILVRLLNGFIRHLNLKRRDTSSANPKPNKRSAEMTPRSESVEWGGMPQSKRRGSGVGS